jgi:hypothetical protein
MMKPTQYTTRQRGRLSVSARASASGSTNTMKPPSRSGFPNVANALLVSKGRFEPQLTGSAPKNCRMP